MASTPLSQPSYVLLSGLLDLVFSLLPAPENMHPGLTASDIPLLQLSEHQRSGLWNLMTSLLPVPAPIYPSLSAEKKSYILEYLNGLASAPIPPSPIVPAIEQTPTNAQVNSPNFDPQYEALCGTASENLDSYTRIDTPSPPQSEEKSQRTSVTVNIYLWERPKDIKRAGRVAPACTVYNLTASETMRSVNNFIKVTAMPEIDSLLHFRPLPTDQIRLARTVMMVKKRLRARWVDGLDGDCSMQDFFKKIGKTSLFIVFVRDKSLDRARREREVAAKSQVSKRARASASSDRRTQRRGV